MRQENRAYRTAALVEYNTTALTMIMLSKTNINSKPINNLDGDVLNSEQATKYSRCIVSATTAKVFTGASN
jgi:hypothetical protein